MLHVASRVYNDFRAAVEDGNAIYQVSDMVALYVYSSGGVAPTDWNSLELAFLATNSGYNSYTMAELQDRVFIDFETLERIAASRDSSTQDLVIIRRNRGRRLQDVEAVANRRVLSALSREHIDRSK